MTKPRSTLALPAFIRTPEEIYKYATDRKPFDCSWHPERIEQFVTMMINRNKAPAKMSDLIIFMGFGQQVAKFKSYLAYLWLDRKLIRCQTYRRCTYIFPANFNEDDTHVLIDYIKNGPDKAELAMIKEFEAKAKPKKQTIPVLELPTSEDWE